MLKRFYPPNDDHLLLSNSETESDGEDQDDFVLRPKRSINREKTIKKKEFKRTSNNKENITLVNGAEGSTHHAFKEEPEDEVIIKEAKNYQEYMKQLPVPVVLESSSSASASSSSDQLPFITWQNLAESMKQKYKQPLHYLTQILLKQWDDQSRGSSKNNEIKPIGNVIHHIKAEATIWVVEEFNRQFTCHDYLAKLWFADPNYHDFVDSIIPK